MTHHRLTKYFALARIAAALSRAERGELLGRAFFFVVILGVYSLLWRTVAGTGMTIALPPKTLIWYIALTEWVLLSVPPIHFEIEQEVRRGDIAYQLPRPLSYVVGALAQGLGTLSVRAPFLGISAFVCAWGYAGGLPEHTGALLHAAPFGIAAMSVLLLFNITIGLSSFWFQAISPLDWLWQKLGLILGGVLMPLEFYPDFIQRLARLTPFPTLISGTGRFVLGGPRLDTAMQAFELFGWFSLALGLAFAVHRGAFRALAVNGG